MAMRIAVVGGTGTVGRPVVERLAASGHDVVVVSRRAPADAVPGTEHRAVDLRSGDGLDAALAGASTVVDVANAPSRSREVLVAGTRRTLDAGRAAGVRHHVLLSIVGCDAVPIGYYRDKVAQERVVAEHAVPTTILRATQFHQLVAMLFGATARAGVRVRASAVLRPVDPGVVAERLAEIAVRPPQGRAADLGGPDRERLDALGDQWTAVTGRGRVPVRVPLPGRAGRALRAGALAGDPSIATGGPSFGAWLREVADA